MIYVVYYQRFFGLLRPSEVKRRWLNFSHRRVKTLQAASPDEVYQQMQAEVWSPQGQARRLIRRLRLGHTSMSVGDVVHSASGEMWVCDVSGWRSLPPENFDDGVTSPSLWMVTEVDDGSVLPPINRLKLSDELDCLPATASSVEQVEWTGFANLVDLARLIEQRLGWSVCIDLGDEFYETEECYRFYVGYTVSNGWHNALISVLATSPQKARQQIEEELKKPGRGQFLVRWQAGGRLVKVKPPLKVRLN